MDAQQGLGTVGTVHESIKAGVAEIDISVKEDVATDLANAAAKMADGWLKSLLLFIIAELKALT